MSREATMISMLHDLNMLSADHTEAAWAGMLIRTGKSPEEALMYAFKYALMANKRLREEVERYRAGTIPPVVIQFPGSVEDFIKLQNSMKGERNAGYESTE